MTEEKFTLFYKGPFSNWEKCKFTVDEVEYCSTEHYMMAEKARLFGDKDAEAAILKTKSCKTAKDLGRLVSNFNKAVWNSVARDIVYKGCYAKFQQNIALFNCLKQTVGTTLVEASPVDEIWGIYLDASDPRALHRDQWLGTNWLGEVLTKVRDDLIAGIYTIKDFGWSE